MVQLLQSPQRGASKETWGQTIAGALQPVVNAGLNMKLNEMLEEKKAARISAYNRKANSQILSAFPGLQKQLGGQELDTDPDTLLNYLKFEAESGGLEDLRNARDVSLGNKKGQARTRETQPQGYQQPRRTLPPGTPPMLNQENTPQGVHGGMNQTFDQGNIDLTNRPMVQNPDGSISNAYAQQFPEDQAKTLEDQQTENPVEELRDQLRGMTEAYNNMNPGKAKDKLYEDIKDKKKEINEERKIQGKEKERNWALGKDYREKISAQKDQVAKEERSLSLAKRAIESGKTNSFAQWAANKWGIDPAKSTDSQLLDLASKEFTIGSLKQVSAKGVNQWLEQRFARMFPLIGTSKQAQETLLAAHQRELNMMKKENELYDKYSDIYNDPQKIERAVYKELQNYGKEEEERLAYQFSLIKDKHSPKADLYSNENATPGEYVTDDKAKAFKYKNNGDEIVAIKKLKELGYKIPTQEQLDKWEKR